MNEEFILERLANRKYKELKKELSNMHPVDLAQIMEDLEERYLVIVFRLLGKEEAAETFTYMNSDMREVLINALNEEEIRDVMDELYVDDTVDILEEMPANVVDRLLEVTDDDTRQRINEILNYPEDSAGSIMTVEYIALRKEMTVAEAILKIRQVGINKETIYTCYVTEKRHLLGYVSVKDLLGSQDNKTIEEIMDTNLISVHTHDDQEDVAKLTQKYGLMAIPVTDHENCMVGIVTVDDAMIVVQEETTEDINKMAAMLPIEDSYFETTVWEHAKKRIPWLLILMLSATASGLIINHFNYIFVLLPTLRVFIPMLTDTGGNCGAQSSSLIIRGIAVDEICFADIFKVMRKEICIAMCVGLFLAVVNGARIFFMYPSLSIEVVFAVSLSLLATVFAAKMIGCLLPLIADKMGLDPAIMAGPLITTIVDSCSLLVYFSIITMCL